MGHMDKVSANFTYIKNHKKFQF